jgi:methyl-accepting chemotaxis protein
MLLVKSSLVKRLVIGIGTVTSLLLILVSIMLSNEMSTVNRDKINDGISQVVSLESERVKSLLTNGYKVLKTSFSAPTVSAWIEGRDEMWQEIDHMPEYKVTNRYLKYVVESEDTVTSLFYSPERTREYWDENGRIPEHIMTKPITDIGWWSMTKKHKGPVVNEPFADSRSGIVSAAISMPLYDSSGDWIAIAGLDIPLQTIQDSIAHKTKFKGKGEAFLFEENGSLIVLPGGEVPSENIQSLDNLDMQEGNSGFSNMRNITGNIERFEIIWNNEPHMVTVAKVTMNEPVLSWRLALIFPIAEIEKPINKMAIELIFMSAFLIIIITIALYILVQRGLSPLNEIGDAMSRIVSGDGDLTQRLGIKYQDEVGRLAGLFNQFVENIQQLVHESVHVSTQVKEASENLHQMMGKADQAVESQNSELDMISTATTEMSHTVDEICESTETTRQATESAKSNVQNGLELVTNANLQINQLADSVMNAEELVNELEVSSQRIGGVLDVIGKIADQTNLLALNAAIEAARAGENGRGFAVVADEVRTLASQTQESTANIQSIINTLHNSTSQVLAVMTENKKLAKISVQRASEISVQFDSLNVQIIDIQKQSIHSAESTSQQSSALEDVSKNLVKTKDISGNTLDIMHQAKEASLQLADESTDLQKTLNKFKY